MMSKDILVTVEQGRIRGKVQEDYHGGSFYSFCGIPYGKAPVGELRFKAPEPAEPWDGIRDGTKEGNECPSQDMFLQFYVGNEDNCLNLNIYTKELPKNTSVNKPVMVFIHGGGFLIGSNKKANNGPNHLMTADIVFVTINYRLGVFGFLCSEDESLGIPGNAGLKDQTLALKWIQKNIHNFGGDAKNVTVFGESAGGASVHYLTLSPLTQGLFQKAIMQSGCALNGWARGKPNLSHIAQLMGYTDADEKTVLQKLRRTSAKSLVNAQSKIKDPFFASVIRPFGPVIEYPHEGAFLAEDPVVIMKSGRSHQIPMIMGYNSMEGLFYEVFRKTRTDASLPKTLEKDIPHNMNIPPQSERSQQVMEQIKEFYYKDEDIKEENIEYRYLLIGDIQFVHGIQKSALLQKRHSTAPVYVYRMSLDSSLNMLKKICETKYLKTMMVITTLTKLLGKNSLTNILQNLNNKLPVNKLNGVAHADDLFYLFSTSISPTITKGSEEDEHIQKMVRIWTDFARTGNPTPEIDDSLDRCVWRPIEGDQIDKIFDINKTVTLTENWEGRRVKFWESLYEMYAS